MIAKLERRLSWRNQDCAIEIAILCKTTIKGYDTKSSSFCKGCQPCITPDLWRKSGSTREISPLQFDANRLAFEYGNLRIINESIIDCPCVDQRNCFVFENGTVGYQPQQPLLCHPTKIDAVVGLPIKPVFRRNVVGMRLECQCQPEIDISEKHHRCSLYRRSCHSSDAVIQDSSKERAAIELSSALAVPSKLVPVGKKPKRPCHREEKRFPAIQQRHLEPHLGFPFQHYHLTEHSNQADVVKEVDN